MLALDDKQEFEDETKDHAFSLDKTAVEKIPGVFRLLNSPAQKSEDNDFERKAGSSIGSPSIRKKKIKEAKRKRRKGHYDSPEVYKKIADRLIDLFGI